MEPPAYGRDTWATDPLGAGKTLVAKVPQQERPQWAAAILATCSDQLPSVPSAVKRVISIGRSRWRWRWRGGHTAFYLVRRLTLKAERRHDEDPAYYLLFVAENAAKVIYNATDPLDPFDDDSGAWLVRCAHDFAVRLGDSHLANKLWTVAADHESAST